MGLISKRVLYTAAIAGLLVSVVAVTPARADCGSVGLNLLTNCGFETGDMTGWTHNLGSGSYDGVYTTPVHSGGYSMFSGELYGLSTWTQTLSLSAGMYDVSFWYWSSGSFPNEVYGSFAGTQFASGVNNAAIGWQQFTASIYAPTGSSVYEIGMQNYPAFDFIDDNVVESAVPEPASLMLLGTGLFGIVGLARRRRQNIA